VHAFVQAARGATHQAARGCASGIRQGARGAVRGCTSGGGSTGVRIRHQAAQGYASGIRQRGGLRIRLAKLRQELACSWLETGQLHSNLSAVFVSLAHKDSCEIWSTFINKWWFPLLACLSCLIISTCSSRSYASVREHCAARGNCCAWPSPRLKNCCAAYTSI